MTHLDHLREDPLEIKHSHYLFQSSKRRRPQKMVATLDRSGLRVHDECTDIRHEEIVDIVKRRPCANIDNRDALQAADMIDKFQLLEMLDVLKKDVSSRASEKLEIGKHRRQADFCQAGTVGNQEIAQVGSWIPDSKKGM